MALAILHSRALAGMHSPAVSVEVHLANGLPAFNLVGLPDTEVKESRDRVRAAIQTARFEFPARRITVNLAPADLPKESGRFDLPIALGILVASGQVPADRLDDYEFAGELGLDGSLRPVRGALAMCAGAAAAPVRRIFVLPPASAAEAAVLHDVRVLAAASLLEVCAFLHGQQALPEAAAPAHAEPKPVPDLADIRGQSQARRALEIAAAGRHSLLLVGPPGAGKSMLAQRLPGILPPMTDREAREAAAVQSLAHAGFDPAHFGRRPWRNPHHTASAVALVGGGSTPRPGEISLAHHGVLFLDELPEFDRKVLEVLREPLENQRICISRAARQAEFPAAFQLVAAMNPCPCGYAGSRTHNCRCSPDQVRRYRARLSGPLLDRVDMVLEMPVPRSEELLQPASGEDSATVRQRVTLARERQLQRQGKVNADLGVRELEAASALPDEAAALLLQAMQQLRLSARAYHRILRLARTLADMEGTALPSAAHVAEALMYRRPLDQATPS